MAESIEDLATRCIRCGFCLEACPTYRLTGIETESPRGRIYLARGAAEGHLDWRDAQGPIDRCLGCRACEPACPSGVEYGRILELARDRIERERPHTARRFFLGRMTDTGSLRSLLAASRLWPGARVPGFVSRLLSGGKAEAALPQRSLDLTFPPLDESLMPPITRTAYLLEGCAMGVLYPGVHEAVRRLMRRLGVATLSLDGCCGALHAHNGHLETAHAHARGLEQRIERSLPIVVDSAGCGAWVKESGVGDVFDVSEFLLEHGMEEALRHAKPFRAKVAYHEACHLAHAQGVLDQPRRLLAAIPGVDIVPLQEADMCCGSAGVYNLFQPEMARRLLDRKWNNIVDSGADLVALGNPGCHAWIAQAARENASPIRVLHTAELLEAAMSGLDPRALT